MRKALTVAIIAVMLFGSLALLPAPAHAATPQWTQKKIILLWDKSYDNTSIGYPDGLAYVKYFFLRTGIITENDIIYDYQLTNSLIENTSLFIIPDMHKYSLNVYNNITAKIPNFFTTARYAILAYYYNPAYGDGETWDGWVQHPPSEIKTATVVYNGHVFDLGSADYFFPHNFVYAVPVVDSAEKIITDLNGNAVFYKYNNNYFGLVPLNHYRGLDIELNALLLRIQTARMAIPLSIIIDDTRDNASWQSYTNKTVWLTYANLENLSKILSKYDAKADLAIESGLTQTEGPVVKAIKNFNTFYATYHQCTAEDYGEARDYNTLKAQYDAGMQNWSRLNIPQQKQDMKIWVLPQGHYNENTTKLASEHGIEYFVIDGFGLNWETYEYWDKAVIKVNKNGNNLPYEEDAYNIYIVDRTFVYLFGSSINAPTTEQEAIQYASDQGWGSLTFSDIVNIELRNELSLYRGDMYFHMPTFTNGEISQKFLEVQLARLQNTKTPYVGVSGYEHALAAHAMDVSTVHFYYANKAVKFSITNPGQKNFPYYVAVPKSLLGSLSSTERYAVTQSGASSAEIVKTDSNYVYVKITVPSQSSADVTCEIIDTMKQAINISIDWTYAIVNAMIPIAIFAVLLSALTQILQAVRKSVRFRK